MPYQWPADTDFALWELDVVDRACPFCGRMMYICDHRYRHFHSLEGPVELVCKLNHCPDPLCSGHHRTKSPEAEITIALPKWAIGWDVLCWIGHRRCSRHWSVPQIQKELRDEYGIELSRASLERYIARYQVMLAARQEDPEALRREYQGIDQLILCIDGLQPEKGHEALYVVRELTGKRVWFAEALLSATEQEVGRLIAKAKAWAAALGKPVVLWLSDKQDAFVKGIAREFPEVPHRYCQNHFLRDVAKGVLESDSHAKVQMRKKVRGLRKIEQAVQERHGGEAAGAGTDRKGVVAAMAASQGVAGPAGSAVATAAAKPASSEASGGGAAPPAAEADSVDAVVLDYCAAVRGIVNDDQGGPLRPPGLRMADALGEVRESIQRNLDEKKGASRRSNSAGWPAASTGAWRKCASSRRSCGSTSRTSKRLRRRSSRWA